MNVYIHTNVNIGATWLRCLCVCCHRTVCCSATRSAQGLFKRVSLVQPANSEPIDQPACQSCLERTAPGRSHWPPGTSVKRWSCSNRARACQRSLAGDPPRAERDLDTPLAEERLFNGRTVDPYSGWSAGLSITRVPHGDWPPRPPLSGPLCVDWCSSAGGCFHGLGVEGSRRANVVMSGG